jgi:Gram-negative bacterial tonB protein.
MSTYRFDYLHPHPKVGLAIVVSVVIHAGLILLLVFGGMVKGTTEDLRDKAIITRLLKKGEEKPKEYLPDKPVETAPPPQTAPAPQVEPPAASKPVPTEPKASSKVDYSKQMNKALSALEHREGRTSKEKQQGSPNGVAEGDSLVAEVGNAYMTGVYKLVHDRYNLPEFINEQERQHLEAILVIRIDRNGKLKQLVFERKSGNSLFDSAVENAVRQITFPPPPRELADKFATEGFGLTFRP